ncbi:MAG TPA: UDP-N-acetylmuramoyl-L-alanyl-D-glutamate--2,6-diaminopimelate ligase [Candidatus Hydrogenedentes bacterium]|nr:UDP-N-acetylmuramoyl-L-alanyl-D-glutamate--2,6-diaminopimelate ligase [Candidatus Hydrogenedentota bacterium]
MEKNRLHDVLACCGGCPDDKIIEALLPIGLVTEDSRRVKHGALFVAVRGEHTDGHDFAAQAVSGGACAILGDRAGISEYCGVPYVYVKEARKAAGLIAHQLAGDPTQGMAVIGVTGTNGKSSTIFMVQSILQAAGHPTAKFGTLGYEIAGEVLPALHTTPFCEELAAHFARVRDCGMRHVVMEVSSHALDQERVSGIRFMAGAFTNLTQDHLDYHHDMERYLQAKLKLFERITGEGSFTVVNGDDPSAKAFLEASKVPCIRYGTNGEVRAESFNTDIDGTRFALTTPWGMQEVFMHLVGRHNVWNALCAASIAGGLGISLEAVAAGLRDLARVPGRFEAVKADQDFHVIVDYAHTDDGLRNVLEAARGMCSGRIITVFGCGGDRDKTKRPKMGSVAAALSDAIIVTSDNPRTEDPHRILLDIEVGLQREGRRKGEGYEVIENRKEAIYSAIHMAQAGDLVMIAGKGHEDYQIIGTTRIHFDDRETARAALEARGR